MNDCLQFDPHGNCRQTGFTAVEVMVSLVISLILLMGIFQIFLNSRTTYTTQSGVSRLQENGRFALEILSRNIGMAGVNAPQGIVAANTRDNFSANTAKPYEFTTANNNASDVIEITYESDRNCLDNNTGGIATDRYYIQDTTLMCTGNGITQPLVDGIENMQILYGEDTDNDKVPNRYVSAANVSNWKKIVSVQIALLVSTVDNAGVTDTNTYKLLNTPTMGPFNDKMTRRVYTRTILLRNFT